MLRKDWAKLMLDWRFSKKILGLTVRANRCIINMNCNKTGPLTSIGNDFV